VTLATLPSVAIIVNALIFLVIPALSRHDIFFSITVSRDFRDTTIARATLRRYRVGVLAGSIGALVAVQMATSSPHLIVPAVFVQTIAATAAWAWAHRTIRPHAAIPSAVRVAALVPRDLSYPGGAVAIVGPFLVLGAAAWLLHANWDFIPDRIPAHWNIYGTPDRWTTKSGRGMFVPLAFAAVIILAVQVQAWFIVRRTRQIVVTGASADAEQQFKRRTAAYSVLSTFIVAALFGYFAMRTVVTSDDNLGWGFALIMGLVVLSGLGFAGWLLIAGQGGQRRVAPDARSATLGDASPDSAWKAGVFYFNPDDSAILVEKRMGLGWTLNLGNRLAWLFLLLAIGVPFLIALFMR